MSTMKTRFVLGVLSAILVISQSLGCPNVCTCIWKQGKQTVECVNKALISIPDKIKSTTQVLDLSGNNFQILPKHAFRRAQLGNLQKIYLRSCKLGHIDPTSFAQLSNLVELDLANNLLTRIPSKTFKDFPLLRRLVLSKNSIQKIENDAFIDLTALSNLELSNCQIESIEPRAFVGLEHLQYLKIEGNKLYTIRLHTLSPLIALNGLDMHNNPWTCDCKLREVRAWMSHRNVPYSIPPRCAAPAYVKDRTWDQMDLDDFACTPEALQPFYTQNAIEGENATIACRIKSIPEATIKWTFNNRIITNRSMTEFGRPKFIIQEVGLHEKTSYLTLMSVTGRDNGSYICTATNNAGSDITNTTLAVGLQTFDTGLLTTPQMAGIILGVLLIFLIILSVVCILSARWRHNLSSSRGKGVTSNHVNHIKAKEIEANCVPVENNKHNIIKENSNFSHESTYGNSNNYTNPETNRDGTALNGPYMSPERTVTNYCVDINEIRYPTYPRNKAQCIEDRRGTENESTDIYQNKRCLPEIPPPRTNEYQVEVVRPPPVLGCTNPVMTSSAYSLDRVHHDYDIGPREKDSEFKCSNTSLRDRDESYGSYYPSPSLRTPNSRPVTTKYLAHMPPSAAHLHMLEIGGPLAGARDSPDEGYDDEGDEGTEV